MLCLAAAQARGGGHARQAEDGGADDGHRPDAVADPAGADPDLPDRLRPAVPGRRADHLVHDPVHARGVAGDAGRRLRQRGARHAGHIGLSAALDFDKCKFERSIRSVRGD